LRQISLFRSFDLYRQQIDDEYRIKLHAHTSSPSVLAHKIETENTEYKREIQPQQASNDNQWNEWLTDSPHITDKEIQHQDIAIQCELLTDNRRSIREPSDSTDHQEPTVANRLFGFFKNVTSSLSEEPSTNDWEDQNSPLQLALEEPLLQQTISSPTSMNNSMQIITNKIQQIVSEYSNLFPNSTGDTLEDLNQLIPIIKNFQNEIKELQR
jgi:hypothetical protein